MEKYIVIGTRKSKEVIIGRNLSFEESIDLIEEQKDRYNHLRIEEQHTIEDIPDKFLVIADANMMMGELKDLIRTPKLKEEQLVFLGNYVCEGSNFYAFMKYLVALKKERDCVFVKGKNEHNLLQYIHQTDAYIGELADVQRMIEKIEKELAFPLYTLPDTFPEFYEILNSSIDFYENNEYIFVSGGLDLTVDYWKQTTPEKMFTTTDEFLLSLNNTHKKIVFGNMPVRYLSDSPVVRPWFNVGKNKIGINGDCKNDGKLLGMFIYEDDAYFMGIRNHHSKANRTRRIYNM